VFDHCANGQQLKCLTVTDEFTKEGLLQWQVPRRVPQPRMVPFARRPGVTLQLLWEEHRAVHPVGYGYSRYCELYRAWEARLSPTMRQSHVAGERLFVDTPARR
jgi:transposase